MRKRLLLAILIASLCLIASTLFAEPGDQATLGYDYSNSTDTWRVNSSGNLIPGTDDNVSIGSSSKQVKDIYVDGTAYVDKLQLDSASPIELEGATADNYETTIAITDPTADRTITLPDESGTVPVVLTGSTTWDPASLADGAGATSSGITVTGAELGDFVLVSAPYDLQDIIATGYVQAADTVEIRLQNESGSTVDLASGTWRVMVFKH